MMKKRIDSLDIIKGIAMIMVIAVHYNRAYAHNIRFFDFGQMGCQIFFVASGFSAALSLSRRLSDASGSHSVSGFYLSRIKGIAPAWWFMMLVVYCINTVAIRFIGHPLRLGSNRSILGLICNGLFLNGLLPFCNNNVMPGGWYIGTLMLLYLIMPPCFHLFQRYADNRLIVCITASCISVLGIIAVSNIAYAVNPQYLPLWIDNNSFGYFFILTQFPCFCAGVLLYFDYADNKSGTALNAVAGACLMAAGMYLYFNPAFKYSYIICVSIVGYASYYILKAMISFEQSHEYRFVKLLKLIGQKSLYIFLVHSYFAFFFTEIVKRLLAIAGIPNESHAVYFIILLFVILLSFISGCILEKSVEILCNIFSRLQISRLWDKSRAA